MEQRTSAPRIRVRPVVPERPHSIAKARPTRATEPPAPYSTRVRFSSPCVSLGRWSFCRTACPFAARPAIQQNRFDAKRFRTPMPAIPKPLPDNAASAPTSSAAGFASGFAPGFTRMSARRLYIFGGIALIAAGLLFGDIFAVFILHQNAALQGEALMAASRAVAAGKPATVNELFSHLGSVLEDRGTKVDAHVHMIGAGYLALLLALVQPFIALSRQTKKTLAILFIAGGVLLPLGIFLIHYVGLAASPFSAIGWASVLADSAGGLLILVLIAQAWGFSKYLRSRELSEPELPAIDSMPSRALLTGGTILVLLGFLHGAYYAGALLYEHERMETSILHRLISASALGNLDRKSTRLNSSHLV